MRTPYESAPTAANGRGAMQTNRRGLQGNNSRLPHNWRDRLPDASHPDNAQCAAGQILAEPAGWFPRAPGPCADFVTDVTAAMDEAYAASN